MKCIICKKEYSKFTIQGICYDKCFNFLPVSWKTLIKTFEGKWEGKTKNYLHIIKIQWFFNTVKYPEIKMIFDIDKKLSSTPMKEIRDIIYELIEDCEKTITERIRNEIIYNL